LDFFGDLKSSIDQSQEEWKKWFASPTPEDQKNNPIPKLGERFRDHPSGDFMRLLVIRSFREDRTRLAVNQFIEASLGREFTEAVPFDIQEIWEDSSGKLPVIMMLTPGADPTLLLTELAKGQGVPLRDCSMGEGQEKIAKACIMDGLADGGWALLQNCHLGLNFMTEIPALLDEQFGSRDDIAEGFRLFITCEEHPNFPVDLLQRSIKVTLEAPSGMKPGMKRSWIGNGATVSNERLTRHDTQVWRDMVLAFTFIHSVVQERRKYKYIGWCIPYEFNTSDLEASLQFLETHCGGSQVNWPTVHYMVTEVQYGGRITDDRDRELFQAFGRLWLKEAFVAQERIFWPTNPRLEAYRLVTLDEPFESYVKLAQSIPDDDSPEVFGLHANADITYGEDQADHLLSTILETRPKENSSGGDGISTEQKVSNWAAEKVETLPPDFVMHDVRYHVKNRPRSELKSVLGHEPTGLPPDDEGDGKKVDELNGMNIPLNMFLFQEIERLDVILRIVRKTMVELVLAIKGEIIMTPQLQEALQMISNGRPPTHWFKDASGALIAWTTSELAGWLDGLQLRYEQYHTWLMGKNDVKRRPDTFWMTGFFNPQGFLTCVKQEVTRRMKSNNKGEGAEATAGWALDGVELFPTIVPIKNKGRGDSKADKKSDGGLLIRGLFLEGASLIQKGADFLLAEAEPRKLSCDIPMIYCTAKQRGWTKEFYGGEDNSAAEKKKWYKCPVYTKRSRTDLAFVNYFKLKSGDFAADHWVLRGVAILCSKDI
jgi:dynein heavy chain